jgi:hypothetical protein
MRRSLSEINMKSLALVLIAPLALALSLPVDAQPAAPAKPASKAAAKPAPKKAATAAPVEAPLPAASDEQKAAASLTHLGDYACEFDQTVNIQMDGGHDGYVAVHHKAQHWTMKPVLSSTGALRLEDVKGRMLMIQIANKSMLMDTQIGQRLVDGCQSAQQREFARTMEPQAGLLKQ